jgi:hypothetical protein
MVPKYKPLLTVLLLLPSLLFPAITKLNLNRLYPVLQAENQSWIGTPTGLYQYNYDDNSFKRFSIPTKFSTQHVKQLHYYEEWLWCVLDSGLAALHVRLNEWLVFDTNNGLPSNTINGIDFLGDYVWIGTNDGAARFDLLIEEWEIYDEEKGVPGKIVKDIIVSNEQVWFETENCFSEYDPDFEKWRDFKVEKDSAADLNRMFLLGEEIWLVSDLGLIRFNPQLQTQQNFFLPQLQTENLREIILEDNSIWAITRLGVYLYEQQTGVWREFEGNSYLNALSLLSAYVTSQQLWILTDQNVLLWDREQKNWEILDYASGLSASTFDAVFSNGSLVFLLKPNIIDYRRTDQEPWRKYTVSSMGGAAGRSGKDIFNSLFDNEAGGKIPLGKYNWGWEGTRFTYLFDQQQRFDYLGVADEAVTKSGERLDVKSQINLGRSRNITGFYNNIDYSETMYGVHYRSREKDILREFNWGDFRREPGKIPFGETANVFGSNVWLQSGPKTDRFKRSRYTMKANIGELRSQKTYEHYQGTTNQFQITIVDTNFLANQFFDLPGLDSSANSGEIQIFVDDLNAYNNTPNTLQHKKLAWITGDFDTWKVTEDYYFYKKANLIRFIKYINPLWTVVARHISAQGITETVLQYNENISTARKNFYYLNAQNITPYSFRLKIKDASGQSVLLNNFQIDEDGDENPDNQWIDFENGYLFFPEAEPFPSAVYDPIHKESCYKMEAEFQTELSLIQLEHNDLVRGSETLRLDGIIAAGGNDYVIDYTNGTLIFVREGIVNPDTRIEIEYEYYVKENTKQMTGALLNWSPSDNFSVQSDWLRFDNKNDSENEKVTNLLSLHSEVRQKIGGYDIRFIPGIAYHPTGKGLAASNIEGLISSSKFRFQTTFENYAENYQNLYTRQSVIGQVKSNLRFFSSLDVRDDVRVTGEWKNVQGFQDQSALNPTDRSGNVTLLFHRQGYPGWQFNFQNFETTTNDYTADKYFFQNRWEYQLPKNLINKVGLQGFKFEAFLRSGQQTGFPSSGSTKQSFNQGYVRLNALFSNQFQGSLFYRRNDLNDISAEIKKAPMSRSERLLMDLVHEEWRLLQMNLRVENTMSQNFHKNSSLKNVRLRQFSQINFRLSPGLLWHVFSSLYFEFNVNQSLYGWGSTDRKVSNWLWQLFGRNKSRLTDYQFNENYYIKNEYRPGSRWFIYSLLEWNNQQTGLGLSLLERKYWRLNEKVDIKLGFKTRLYLKYRHFDQDMGYDRTIRYFEPSIWIEHRWTPDFQNILNLLYRQRRTGENNIIDKTFNWEARYDLIWRKYKLLGIRRIELRQSFSGNFRRTSGYNPAQIYQFGSSSSLDLYPLHSMIFRLRFDLNQYLDDFIPEYAYYNYAINLKLSLRF